MGGRGSGTKTKRVFVPEPGTELYERQSRESDQAWAAFVAYRDLGLDRTVEKAVQVLGKKRGYRRACEEWSARWGWRVRCEAWDRKKDEHGRQAELDEVAEMRKRHIRFATTLQGVAGLELQRLVERAKAGTVTLGPDQLLRILEAGVKLERFNRGEPERRDEVTVRTPEERDARIQHLLKALDESDEDDDRVEH